MNSNKLFLQVAACLAAVGAGSVLRADPMQVTGARMSQDSGNTVLTVDYNLTAENPAFVRFDVLTNGVSLGLEHLKTVSGDGYSPDTETLISTGARQIVWHARKDWPDHVASNAQVKVMAYYTNHLAQVPGVYMVVDLSGGPTATSYPISYTLTPPDPTDVACYSNQLWLKRIETNTFMMGSAATETGHQADEVQHRVTLTQAFFLGVFPVTVAQYQLVTGLTPSDGSVTPNAFCPVNKVSYEDLRGTTLGSQWPTASNVDGTSFFGILQTRTGNLLFDIPTEAQWEYACRAGTTDNKWNDGSSILSAVDSDANLNNLGWYSNNGSSSTHQVGQKMPNAWGLYDCHGNVYEWCLDWYDSYGTAAAVDPAGPFNGAHRLIRGGAFGYYAFNCRSACRNNTAVPSARYYGLGFRISLVVGQ